MDESVEALAPGMTGRWQVTTRDSVHIWDLDAMTFERRPQDESRALPMDYDGEPQQITRVEAWPQVGSRSFVWYDDPTDPRFIEQWRISSQIAAIERLPDS